VLLDGLGGMGLGMGRSGPHDEYIIERPRCGLPTARLLDGQPEGSDSGGGGWRSEERTVTSSEGTDGTESLLQSTWGNVTCHTRRRREGHTNDGALLALWGAQLGALETLHGGKRSFRVHAHGERPPESRVLGLAMHMSVSVTEF